MSSIAPVHYQQFADDPLDGSLIGLMAKNVRSGAPSRLKVRSGAAGGGGRAARLIPR